MARVLSTPSAIAGASMRSTPPNPVEEASRAKSGHARLPPIGTPLRARYILCSMLEEVTGRPAKPANIRHGPRRPPSIKDIARIARVSHSTVSRALQNSPLVNARTAETIRQIAHESGYRASAVARGLVTKRTLTIGLVVTTIADPFASEVVGAIEQAANDHGYSVFLADSNADPVREQQVVQSLAERRVDGIVVTSSRVGALYLPLLSEMRVPIVLVNNQHPGEFVHSIMIGNVEGVRAVAEHLIGLGHKRIAYIGDQYGYQSDTERFAGYRETLDA